MSDDPRIRAMLGFEAKQAPPEPEAKPERLDLSRCVVYATRSQANAEGQFKRKYGVTPSVSVATEIGGRNRVRAWLCGLVPEDWHE